MTVDIISPAISRQDAAVSLASLDRIRPFLSGNDRSLVFFVGAGASFAGDTQMPTTKALLKQLLLEALKRSGEFDIESSGLAMLVADVSEHIGLEITLNDLLQICPEAVNHVYTSFALHEERCTPNRVHAFLAQWLSTGGIVLTTNFDCLIEREWLKLDSIIDVRYQDEGRFSFTNWKRYLSGGGCLFKIHGSLGDPTSCLGALEQVGTRLAGHRADLLSEIAQRRPLCFVGWSGADPDIPPLLSKMYAARDCSRPVFWIHFEGESPGSISIQNAIDAVSPLVKEYASDNPVLTEADRAFAGMLPWLGRDVVPRLAPPVIHLDLSEAVGQCSVSGVTRFAGIAFRRSGQLDGAERVLTSAHRLSQIAEERASALQELALLQQQKSGRRTGLSRWLLEQSHAALGQKRDPWLELNFNFGMLSMTVVALYSTPWLLLKLPALFRNYARSIEVLHRETSDSESVALHESLLHLYQGRLRLKLVGWLAIAVPPLANWVLRPFDVARSTIGNAKDIHLHSRVDVLAYRAVALARLRRCRNATEDLSEISRLVAILTDHARAMHWESQRQEIERRCGDAA